MEYSEFYSVDINPKGTLLIYGGKSEILYVSNFPTLKIIHEIDDFDESIIYLRFINDEYFIAATIDGTLSMFFTKENEFTEVSRLNVEDDITKIDTLDKLLVVGTKKGFVYVFKKDFNDEICLVGHDCEIMDIIKVNNQLYTLSVLKLIIYDLETEEIVSQRKIGGYITMCYSGGLIDKLFLASEYKSIILRNGEIVSNFNYGAESIIFLDGYFISGGDSCSINSFNADTSNNLCERYDFSHQNVTLSGISKIKSLGNEIIAFSTFCGKIGAGYYKKPKTYCLYDVGVGIIYDFRFFYRHIIVCGSHGVNTIDI